jgi:hypothetical protein
MRYPYAGMADAQRPLCLLANRLANPGCGVSFCDGRSITVLRRPTSSAGTELKVLVHRVATLPPPPPPSGLMQKIERSAGAVWDRRRSPGVSRLFLRRAAGGGWKRVRH